MSKDKYRPSIADFEVSRTTGSRRGTSVVDGDSSLFGGSDLTDSPDAVGPDGTPRESEQSNWYPKNFRVKSQTVRYNEQGRMRVDVTFEWDELDSAREYFIRLAGVTN